MVFRISLALLLGILLSFPASGAGLPWKAGVAKVKMTPKVSLWMAGYASRNRPSEGVYQDLFVRALALQDPAGRRAVLVTTDMLGFPAALSRRIAGRSSPRCFPRWSGFCRGRQTSSA